MDDTDDLCQIIPHGDLAWRKVLDLSLSLSGGCNLLESG